MPLRRNWHVAPCSSVLPWGGGGSLAAPWSWMPVPNQGAASSFSVVWDWNFSSLYWGALWGCVSSVSALESLWIGTQVLHESWQHFLAEGGHSSKIKHYTKNSLSTRDDSSSTAPAPAPSRRAHVRRVRDWIPVCVINVRGLFVSLNNLIKIVCYCMIHLQNTSR